MKKFFFCFLALFMLFFFEGCRKKETKPSPDSCGSGQSEQTPSRETESGGSSPAGTEELLPPEEKQELLPLQYLPSLEIEQTGPAETETRPVQISCEDLPETGPKRYGGEEALKEFAGYMKEKLGIEPDGNWQVTVHYYDAGQTVGMVQFRYFIGEIGTDKSVLFNLDCGKADTVWYSCLNGSADEEILKARVSAFERKYRQESYVLQEGESFQSEETDYVYYYGTGELFYCYAVYFSYGEDGIINNDYGTVCRIGENGEAVFG